MRCLRRRNEGEHVLLREVGIVGVRKDGAEKMEDKTIWVYPDGRRLG